MIELLTVIVILAVLLALILPAVQHVREKIRVLECRNRMKQLALATHTFHDSQRHLPGPLSPMAAPSFPRMLSPWAHLLPQLEQAALFLQIDQSAAELGVGITAGLPVLRLAGNKQVMETPLMVVRCPSDRSPPSSCNFRACLGTQTGGERRRVPGSGWWGVWYHEQGPKSPLSTFANVVDGFSQTALVSERVVGDHDPTVFTNQRDLVFFDSGGEMFDTPEEYLQACQSRGVRTTYPEFSFSGATWLLAARAYTVYDHILPPNAELADCSSHDQRLYSAAVAARSWHSQGVNVAFADGSARFVSNDVDWKVWRALGTRDGREEISWE